MVSSAVLRAEYSAAIIDGFMSAGIGVALVSIRYVSLEGSFAFLHYIGDSLLVLLLCLLLGRGPLVLILDSFIEIAGGTLQNKKEKLQIEGVLHKYLQPEVMISGNYISKTGSSYLVVAYVDTESVASSALRNIPELKIKITTELQNTYPNILLEIVLA